MYFWLSLKIIIIVRWAIFIIKLICSFYILIITIIWFLYLKKLLVFYLLSLIKFLLIKIINFIFILIVHHLYLLFRNFRLVMFGFCNLFFCFGVRNIQSSSGCIVWLWKLIEFTSLVFNRLRLFNLNWLFRRLFHEIDLFNNQVKSDIIIITIIYHSSSGQTS